MVLWEEQGVAKYVQKKCSSVVQVFNSGGSFKKLLPCPLFV